MNGQKEYEKPRVFPARIAPTRFNFVSAAREGAALAFSASRVLRRALLVVLAVITHGRFDFAL